MDSLPAGKPLGFPAFQLGSSAPAIAGVGMLGESMRSSNARTQCDKEFTSHVCAEHARVIKDPR
jgi:hypothetical protein